MPMAIMAESFAAVWQLPWRAVVRWRLDSIGENRDFSNIIFGNIVKPMVLATLSLEML